MPVANNRVNIFSFHNEIFLHDMYDYGGYHPIATIIFGIKYIGNLVEKMSIQEIKNIISTTGNANSSDTLFLPCQQSVCVQNKHSA